jgi:hypothetical protein
VTPSFSDLLPYLLAIAGLSLAMVFVMVRWTAAMLPPPPRSEEEAAAPAEGWPPAVRWGFAYAAVWALLIVAFLRFLEQVRPAAPAGRNLLLMLLVAAAWLLFNWGFIALVRALQRADERNAARAKEEEELELHEEESAAEEEEDVAAEPEIEPTPAPPPTIGARIRGVLQMVLMIAGALLIIGVGEALPPLQRLHAWTAAHQKALLAVTIPMGVIGLALFISGLVSLALFRNRAMSREEVNDLATCGFERGPALWRRSSYRTSGMAVGVSVEDSASFSEIKAAWRDGTWKTSPRWRRMFLVLLGVAMLTTGIFGSIFVIAQAGMKLLIGGAYLYAVIRTAIGSARA